MVSFRMPISQFKKIVQLFLITISFLFPTLSHAGWDKIASTEFVVPVPPDATASKNEIEILLQFQNERSKQQCDLGLKQEIPGFKAFFDDVSFLTAHQFQIVEPLMDKVSKFGQRVADYYKNKYHRTRPFRFDSQIVPCIPPPMGNTSYPSSHAAVATLDACILAEIFPSMAAQYKDIGVEVSERRLQIGVHFPSDVNAGENLANDICHRLLQDPEFHNELTRLSF